MEIATVSVDPAANAGTYTYVDCLSGIGEGHAGGQGGSDDENALKCRAAIHEISPYKVI